MTKSSSDCLGVFLYSGGIVSETPASANSTLQSYLGGIQAMVAGYRDGDEGLISAAATQASRITHHKPCSLSSYFWLGVHQVSPL